MKRKNRYYNSKWSTWSSVDPSTKKMPSWSSYNLFINMKYFYLLLIMILVSCKNRNPAFSFSQFDNTPVEALSKAVEKNNLNDIREEVIINKSDIDYLSPKYGTSLLLTAMVHNKKEAFSELLKLGANPNLYDNKDCITPLLLALKINKRCDLFYIKELLKYDIKFNLGLHKKCNFEYDPILTLILEYNLDYREKCSYEILKLFDTKLDGIDLKKFNNKKEYEQNIIYFCLRVRNMSALKFLIIDLNCQVPEKIFIDSFILRDNSGFYSLEDILKRDIFNFEPSGKRQQMRLEILNYLKNNK
ncbi:hypothetical protein [Aureivirga sp. CE67]|uniref:hypothetical protein n=1 Tax=Aureivirga sp. CE67 TaxID=1788983 RepID=UPI0018CBA77D|nr:hypothetical protein [Aureivirga sp. CE67]